MRAEKSRSSGNENAPFKMLHGRSVTLLPKRLLVAAGATLIVEQAGAYLNTTADGNSMLLVVGWYSQR